MKVLLEYFANGSDLINIKKGSYWFCLQNIKKVLNTLAAEIYYDVHRKTTI